MTRRPGDVADLSATQELLHRVRAKLRFNLSRWEPHSFACRSCAPSPATRRWDISAFRDTALHTWIRYP